MKGTRGAVAVLSGMLAVLAVAETATPQKEGDESSRWETAFRAIPSPERMRDSMRRLSARPHHVGSAYDRENAEWILARFKEYGWDASIERYDVLFPTPKSRLLEMTSPTRFVARLEEPPVAEDPTSNQKSEQLPTYNAYSVDGDVSGPLVYVNYGRPEDYEQLDRLGITVKGAIAIARYGACWRGIKPKVAAERGAVGCLIYSDPRDDGYFEDEVFPAGPMRNKDGVQRGSVMDMPVYPGDPLTPGKGATPGAARLALKDVPTLTKIPVLPISYGDAQPLLAAMQGPVAPQSWRGALPITYHVGPGPAAVRLKVEFNWDVKPLYDVIARIAGTVYPEEWVLRGNHHDAWVNGASDPVSGMAALLEEARSFGELRKKGWSPKRTIIYAAWDGEEPGLLGSTEWVEAHESEVADHAVAYVNTDGNGRGYLGMGGSHTLERFMNDVARSVDDPETQLSIWKRLQARIISTGTDEERKEARTRPNLRLGALGSGSDYTPFLQHAGVACLNLGFGGEDNDGIYHSIYDDFYHYTRFSDTEFVYGRALAQTAGSVVLRLAVSDLLPHDFVGLAETVGGYVKDLQSLLAKRQAEVRETNRQLDDGVFERVNDPKHSRVPPPRKEVPPALNFAPLENASTALEGSAARYQKALEVARPQLAGSPETVARINTRLRESERQLTDPSGLPNRNWYRHLIYAPGFYTGYGVKTIPGVREAIEQGFYAEVDGEVSRAAAAIARLAELVNQSALELERLARAR